MTRVKNARHNRQFVVAATVAILVSFAGTHAQASVITGDTIFHDDFTGTTLDSVKWTSYVQNGGTYSVGSGMLTMQTTAGSNTMALKSTDLTNFGLTQEVDDWWAEIKYSMIGNLDTSLNVRQWIILRGGSPVTAPATETFGFDLLAEKGDGGTTSDDYILKWYSWDGESNLRVAETLATLQKETAYTVSVHMKSDGMADIYIDDVWLAEKAVIGDENPTSIYFGDLAGSGRVYGKQAIDYIKVNVVVPEPGALVLLVSGLLGMVCFAWRKRK